MAETTATCVESRREVKLMEKSDLDEMRRICGRAQTIHYTKLLRLIETHEIKLEELRKFRALAAKYRKQRDGVIEILKLKTLTNHERDTIKHFQLEP